MEKYFLSLVVFVSPLFLFGQCDLNQLACLDFISVSLNSSGEYVITPDQVLVGDEECELEGISVKPNRFDCADIKVSPLKYRVIFTNGLGEETLVCWGRVKVEDKMAPQITCPPNISLPCNGDPSPKFTGFPTVTDNCAATASYSDMVILQNNPCGRNGILRTWVAEDASGNLSTPYQQKITFGGSVLGGQRAFNVNETSQVADQLKVFPNPTSDVLRITFGAETNTGLVLRLMDMNGRSVMERRIEPGRLTAALDVSAIPAGLYILRTVRGGAMGRQYKVVIQ